MRNPLRLWAALFAAMMVSQVACQLDADEDADAADDDSEYSEKTSELALPGAWQPPPDVRSAGAGQFIPYSGAPAWNGGAGCSGRLMDGTRQLGDFLRATFPGRVSSYGGYACRQNTANKAQLSVHGTGRALDVFIPLDGGQADNGKGDEVANWLVRNAASIGVQYIIWDRRDWGGSRGGEKLGAYTGPHPHHDHIHLELTPDGAARRTPWFRNPGTGAGAAQQVLISRAGDFNGDGKDDAITFGRGDSGDVYVALSTGTAFLGGAKWHDFFSIFGELPAVGDFNGDGKSDLVTFTRGDAGDVIVSLSNGAGFLGASKWHDFFSIRDEIPGVGDFNGDGKDDVITFGRGDSGDVYVALSTGAGFQGGAKWSDFFCIFGEVPAIGDFDGDGKDDVVTFTRGASADVIVSLSNGNGFNGASKWHDFFAVGAELPVVADFNGDGKDDIATYTRGDLGDVYVALSTGTGFLGATKWSDWMTPAQETPGAGDFDGDGKADAITFVRGDRGDVYVARSEGDHFAGSTLWNDFFSIFAELPQPGVGIF